MKVRLPMLIALSLLSAPVLAGERLVQGDSVNLRAGPGQDKAVLTRLGRGTRVKEISTDAEWVQVEPVQPTVPTGWIHASMLSTPAFADFKKQFDHRNARARELTGETFFHEVVDQGDGLIRVVASDVWLDQPEAGRLDNLRYILWIWSQAQPEPAAGTPLKVSVVDLRGAQRMELEGKAGEEPKAE